jgi:hypothetical protein
MSFFTSITQILPLILVSNLNSQRLLQLYQRLSCRTALDNTCSTAYTLNLISPSQPNLPFIPSTLRLLLSHSESLNFSCCVSFVVCSVPQSCVVAVNNNILDLKVGHSTLLLHLVRNPYARFTVISGKNLRVPSERIPAGIHVSINVDSRRRWKSALRVLSSEESVVWGDTVTM